MAERAVNEAESVVQGGYAPVNGLNLYYQTHGERGERSGAPPLILLHGGFGLVEMFSDILPALAKGRQVIGVDLQAHGRTADIDRPLRSEHMADDIAALIQHLDHERVDIMGYSLGGGVALQTVIRHPTRIRKLVVLSAPFKRSAWFPEVQAGFDQIGPEAAEAMKPSPMYQAYARVAPRPEDFPVLVGKIGELTRMDYDWSAEVAKIQSPTLLVFADADGVSPRHAAEFYELLGGGQQDPGWDHARMPKSQLAILPGTSHYNCFQSPLLADIVPAFLDAKVG